LANAGAQVDIGSVLNATPKTKEEFDILSRQIFDLVIKRHQDKPLYAAFVEAHAKELASPLKDVDVRKVASGLTALANEKQREAKDKTSGKKKKAPKPVLGSTKTIGKFVSEPEGRALILPISLMLTSAVTGSTQIYTMKRWMTLVTIRTTSCEDSHHSVLLLDRCTSLQDGACVVRLLVVTAFTLFVVSIRVTINFRFFFSRPRDTSFQQCPSGKRTCCVQFVARTHL